MKNPVNVRRETRDGQTKLRAFFLAGCATAALMSGASIAHADGGQAGWSTNWTDGGSGYTGEDGDDGDGDSFTTANGGGGGGAGGGDGGDSGTGDDGLAPQGLGGAGGTALDPDGADGTNGSDTGGGGGGGGYNGADIGLLDNSGTLTGGDGGDGGDGTGESSRGPSGGGGGAGGYGAVITASGEGNINRESGVISGGNGGDGGNSATATIQAQGPNGGWGGDGGVGVQFGDWGIEFLNEGTITGGDGGNGGDAGAGSSTYGIGGSGGAGGDGISGGGSTITNTGRITGGRSGSSGSGNGSASQIAGRGIEGSSLTIINSGTISGGDGLEDDTTSVSPGYGIRGSDMTVTNSGTIQSGDEGAGTAIYFSSGTNRLTLEEGSTILGKVYGGGGANDTLALGGSGNASFDLTEIGRQYSYFDYFEKTGTGTWTVTGIATSEDPMPWTIASGILVVGDAETPYTNLYGNVKIGAAGVLSGTGTVTGTVSNYAGGQVMPGMADATGRLVIDGNYYQRGEGEGQTGNLRVLVTPTEASQLAVTGTAILGGTVQTVYAPGVYEARGYSILTAVTISGTFDGTTSQDLPEGFEQSLAYSSTTVALVLAEGGGDGGGMVVEPTDSTTFSATGSSTINGSQTSTTNLFDYLNGQRGGGNGGGTAFLTKPIKIAMAGDGGLAELLSPAATVLYNVWFRATGRLSDLDGSGATAGFKTKSGGFMGGIDRDFGDGFTAGVALGFDQTYIDEDNGNSGHVSSPRIALYGSHEAGPLAFDATIGYAHHFIDTRRFVTATAQTAEADHGGDEFAAGVQASYRFDMDGVTVTPKAGAMYTYLSEESFNESGAPGFNLNVASKNTESLRPFVGVDLATSFTTNGGTKLTPQLSLDYSRETMADAPSSTVTVGGGTFTVRGLEPSKNRVTAGLSLDVEMDERLSLHTGYRAVLPTGNLFAQSLEVGLTYKF